MSARHRTRLWILILVATVYVVAGKSGLQLAVVHASATPVWPPTGIAVAACLLLGRGVWPALFVGAFLVNVTTAGSVLTSLGVALGNTLEGVLAALLVERFAHGRRTFERAKDIFAFAGLAAFIATTVSATIGVGSLAAGGFVATDTLGAMWLTWWMGDAAGALIVTPLLVLWA